MKAKTLLTSFLLVVCLTWATQANAQDIIDLSKTATDKISTELTNYTGSSTDVTVIIPSGYGNPEYTLGNALVLTGIPSTIKNLTIQGDGSNPTLLVKNIDLPASGLTSIKLKDLTLKGLEDGSTSLTLGNYLFASTNVIVPTITVEGCSLANFRGIMRMKTGANFANVTFDNCIIRNTGSYCLLVTEAGSILGNYTIRNSTVYGTNTTLFGVSASLPATFTISDCTFDNIIYTTGKYFIDFGTAVTTTTTLNISNTIIGKTAYSGGTVKGIRGSTGYTYTVTNSYITSDCSMASPALIGFTAYENTAANLFASPTTFDGAAATASVANYSFKDATFAGATNAGDPRWYSTNAVISPRIQELKVYPNPTTDIINFDKNYSQVEILNLVGITVKSIKDINQCSLINLSKGTYFVRTTDETGSLLVQKISKN